MQTTRSIRAGKSVVEPVSALIKSATSSFGKICESDRNGVQKHRERDV